MQTLTLHLTLYWIFWMSNKKKTSLSERTTDLLKAFSIINHELLIAKIGDLLFLHKERQTCSYASDTTPYPCDQNIGEIVNRSENGFLLLVSWFKSNYMKLSTGKYHVLISGHK